MARREDFRDDTSAVIFEGSDDRQTYSIVGSNYNDTLGGNKGSDTIEGGNGNDLITGNGGADIFVYALGAGNDTITDYEEDDVIQFTSGTPTYSIKGNNVILTVGSGSKKGTITVVNAAEKAITYEDANGDLHVINGNTVNYNSAGTAATLETGYTADQFTPSEYSSYPKLKNIDASAVANALTITGNKLANNIIGTDEDDYISGAAGKDTINGGDGNDTIEGGKGNDNLTGGGGENVFVYNNGDGNDVITDYKEGDIIRVASGSLSSSAGISGNDYVFYVGKGKITVKNGKDKYIHLIDAYGNDVWWPSEPTPGWVQQGTTVTITDEYRADTFDVAEFDDFAKTIRVIDASEATKSLEITGNKQANRITGTSEDDTIHGMAGKDTIYGGDGNDVIEGGTGNDNLTGGDGADTFVYSNGDGNDTITDYEEEDTIQIAGLVSKVSTAKNGNVTLTVGKGKITIKDAADVKIIYEDNAGVHVINDNNPVDYNDAGTAATLNVAYSAEQFTPNEYSDYSKLKNIDASAVEHSLTITGNDLANNIIGTGDDDYIDGAAGKDTINGGDGNDTIIGGKGNDNLTGGDGADVFVWNKGDGNDKINDYENEDTIQFNSDTVKSIKKSGSNLIFTLTSKSKLTVVGGAEDGKVISYVDNSHPDGVTYPEVVDAVEFSQNGKGVTIKAEYTEDSFDVADYAEYKNTIVTIDASAADQDLEITANKKNNIITGGAGNDEIYGGAGNDVLYGGKAADELYGEAGADTLEGGAGNDTLTGGAGADVFVWSKGGGNDTIVDFTNEDSLEIKSDTVKKFTTSKNGKDVVLTLASKAKITFKDAADKFISYTDANGEGIYPDTPIIYNEDHTGATLSANYTDSQFTPSEYSEYASTIETIDGSAVTNDIEITGNAKANRITGSDQNDTLNGGAGNDILWGGKGDDSLWGGTGTDTLYGGDGEDTFIYNNGDGKTVIADFDEMDTIMVQTGRVGSYSARSGNVTFETDNGSGSIVVQGGADKHIEIVDSSGNLLKHYSP